VKFAPVVLIFSLPLCYCLSVLPHNSHLEDPVFPLPNFIDKLKTFLQARISHE
jgi:hypothetical protein